MVRNDTDDAPQDEPQAGSVVLEVTVVYEQEARLKENQKCQLGVENAL